MIAMRDDQAFQMCLNPACSSGQIHDDSVGGPIMTCHTCSYKICFHHKRLWHEGQTCEEYDSTQQRQAEEERASAELVGGSSTMCPGCEAPITKIDGCDHMACKFFHGINKIGVDGRHYTDENIGAICRAEFCYLCRASYDDIRKTGNSAHANDCEWYRLPPPPPPMRSMYMLPAYRSSTPWRE